MPENHAPLAVLMAEDDPDDQKLTRKAFERAGLHYTLTMVNDGEELMAYLRRELPFENLGKHPEPDLILLDLNMPKKDGRAALQEIRADENLRHIPIVALTTSKAEQDVLRSYQLGINSYITKPVTFDDLVKVVKPLGEYWSEIVRLPQRVK